MVFNGRMSRFNPQPLPVTPAPLSEIAPTASLDVLRRAIEANTAALQGLNKAPAAQPFSTQTIDLTAAHTNLEIINQTPFDYLQVFSDGGYEGITLRIGTQNSDAVALNQMVVIPVVGNPRSTYLTSDVRQGRTRLTLYWTRNEKLEIARGGQDIQLAEAAIRNGAVISFDRRGEVIFQDDFENGLAAWYPYMLAAGGGVGGSIALSTAYSKSKGVSAKLTPDNANLSLAQISHYEPYPSLTRYGLETAMVVHANLNINLYFAKFDGTNRIQGVLQYLPGTTTLRILDSAGSPITIDNALSLAASNYLFHAFKLVVDFATSKYIRAIAGVTSYDLSQYDLYTAANATGPYLASTIEAVNTAASLSATYIDDAIVTNNE